MQKEGNYIEIKNARVHNLKNVSLKIPRDKFVVITGLSGSGKSSLAFDTLYAEGQRRYVESLSSYARQFLGRISRPDVDIISGVPPAIAIEQRSNTKNPRSTVGTSTEIYEYLKLLYARIGKTFSPVSGIEIKKNSVQDIVKFIFNLQKGTIVNIFFQVDFDKDKKVDSYLSLIQQQGYTRIFDGNKILKISEVLENVSQYKNLKNINILVDRIEVADDEDNMSRAADSVQTALFEGKGLCTISYLSSDKQEFVSFSSKFEADGLTFDEPTEQLFSYNSPAGACPRCEGFGQTIGIDEDLVIPNKSLSIYEGAVACWKGEKMQEWCDDLIKNAYKFNFPIHKPFYELSNEQKSLLWSGNKYFNGLTSFFKFLEENSYKIQYRVMMARYRGKTKCPDCNGSRLRKEAGYVRIGGKSITELAEMPIAKLYEFFSKIKFNDYELSVAKRIIHEINCRLEFLLNVGLDYLTLNRPSNTLSGGESQRINLATSLGSSLVGSLYILDEPSIGLHPRDTNLLINSLKNLQQIGNSLLVVEHDENIIRSADHIIDIGPLAGRFGGEVVFQGNYSQLEKSKESLTAKYILGKENIETPKQRRKWNNYIEVVGARENNLKNITVKFPLNVLTVVTGVSGSGKSTLVNKILYPALKKFKGIGFDKTGDFDTLNGDIHFINEIEFVDQNPIGKSSRSNPVTYVKAYDEIRNLFAEQKLSKLNGFKPSHFSFNVEGGRCDECQGDGVIKIEMQFMADVHLLCESCNGHKFKEEILEVKYHGKNIYDVLEMTVEEAIEFFTEHATSNNEKRIINKIKPLFDTGLGYVKLGQSSSTLSGGESQRVKLASFILNDNALPSIYIFDEPTTGLHFHDVRKLMDSFNELIKKGHTIIIIEHNLDVIKSADWVIDLGPDGGEKGGELIFAGTPEDLINCKNSFTGHFLKNKI